MCGRFTSTSSIDILTATFGVEQVRAEPLPLRWNVAPTQQVYAVACRGHGDDRHRALGTLRWGLVPSWAKDLSVGAKMINARSEGIGERPAYRKALLARRCVIPVDAFYEWQARAGSKVKQPWAVRRGDGVPMAMAGLWEAWRDPRAGTDAEWVRSCAIVTTQANRGLASIHHRMPVVLGPDAVDRWLDPELRVREKLEALLVPAPSDWFDAYPVTTLVNRVALDGPELLVRAPTSEVELPPVLDDALLAEDL